MPTTTKTSSGFHICDILELNKDKKKKISTLDNDEEEKKEEICENEDVEDEVKVDNEISERELKCRRTSSPPTSPQNVSTESQSSDDARTPTKHHDKIDFNSSNHSHHQLLNETIHQYPHLFHNHPAMRPWFNSNGKHQN